MLRQEEIKRIVDAARTVISTDGAQKAEAESELRDAIDDADRLTALRKPASYGTRTVTDSTDAPSTRSA